MTKFGSAVSIEEVKKQVLQVLEQCGVRKVGDKLLQYILRYDFQFLNW